jgi:hypothetical protein
MQTTLPRSSACSPAGWFVSVAGWTLVRAGSALRKGAGAKAVRLHNQSIRQAR